MSTLKSSTNIVSTRSSFIEILSDESTSLTGYGIYAHLSPFCIEELFIKFTNQNLPARTFAKQYLKTII